MRTQRTSLSDLPPAWWSMNPSTPTSNRFLGRASAIYSCIFFLSCLVLFNIAIFLLQATHFFEKHLFDLRKISAVSQVASITTQTCAVIVLIILSYAMQLVASDAIIRRSQSLAALHDNLVAWRGLGSSLLALWRSRDLGVRAWSRVLLACAFFVVVSALHIVTPSVITVGTLNAPLNFSLEVSTVLNISIEMWRIPSETWDNPFSVISYLWPQLGTNTNNSLGLPPGVNGSVLFSTLPSPLPSVRSQDVVFRDPYARDLSVRCGIIPRVSGDSFEVSYTEPGASNGFQNDSALIFNLTAGFEPSPGVMQWYTSDIAIPMSSGFFALGGNQSMSAHPVFWFHDVLLRLPFTALMNNSAAVAFAYISIEKDSLKLNPFVGFALPVEYVLQTQTGSFVNNDSTNINATFYIWPIACSMFSQNITVEVRGDNVLLQKSSPSIPSPNPTPFIHQEIPEDPWEALWGDFITTLNVDYAFKLLPHLPTSPGASSQVLPPFTLQLLSGLNNTNDSLALLGEQLATATSLSCAILLQLWHTSPPTTQWSPVLAEVPASLSIIMGGLVVQTLPLIIGTLMCSILIFVFIAAPRWSKSSDNSIQDGQLLNMICLLHHLSLPMTVTMDGNIGLQRIHTMGTHTVYEGHTLNIDPTQQRQPPSSAIALTLDTAISQHDHSSNMESLWASSSTSLLPRPDRLFQRNQLPQRIPQLYTGLWPYLITYIVMAMLLASFYLVLIGLWFTHVLDHSLFDIKRLGQVNQFVSLLSQAWAVGTISVITFTVQAIASDLAIRRRQTVAALHDTLASWLGIIYSVVALFQNHDHFQTQLQLVFAFVFFVSISLLHISTPSVITVHAVNGTVPFNSLVIKMPGNLAHISPSAEAQDDLGLAIESIPFLWDQRNSSIGLPLGYNGMTLFSTLERPTAGNIIFEDPYARRSEVQCGSFPDSTLNIFNITYHPGQEPDPSSLIFHHAWFTFDLELAFPLSQVTTMMFKSSPSDWGLPGPFPNDFTFSFGGGKKSVNDAPNYSMNDLLLYLPQDQSNGYSQSYNMGAIALAYISLNPDAFHLNPVGGDIPFVVDTEQFEVWSWIGNSTSAAGPVELEQVNVTFYIWPILCSLSVHNVTAWVRSDGDTQLERTNFNMTLANSTSPLIDAMVPSDPMVTSWSYIVDILFSDQSGYGGSPTWLEQSLNQTTSLTSLEDWLSNFATFYYAFLVQHWRTNGNLTGSQWWSEATGSVVGTQLVLFGRLDINPSQLVLGCVCFVTMIIASAASMVGLRIHRGAVMDGSVMDMITLLRGSSLPRIIAGDGEDLGRDGLRDRAERTIVMYKNGTLDIPEPLEHGHLPFDSEAYEMTGLQNSLRTITQASSRNRVRSGQR